MPVHNVHDLTAEGTLARAGARADQGRATGEKRDEALRLAEAFRAQVINAAPRITSSEDAAMVPAICMKLKLTDRSRKITAGTTIISPVAGSLEATTPGDGGAAANAGFNAPRYVVLDSSGNIFITDNQNCAIRRIDASTQIITTYAGQIGVCGPSLATTAWLRQPY